MLLHKKDQRTVHYSVDPKHKSESATSSPNCIKKKKNKNKQETKKKSQPNQKTKPTKEPQTQKKPQPKPNNPQNNIPNKPTPNKTNSSSSVHEYLSIFFFLVQVLVI